MKEEAENQSGRDRVSAGRVAYVGSANYYYVGGSQPFCARATEEMAAHALAASAM